MAKALQQEIGSEVVPPLSCSATMSNPRGICLGHSSLTAYWANELARLAERPSSEGADMKIPTSSATNG